MAAKVGSVVVDFVAKTNNFIKGVKGSQKSMSRFRSDAKRTSAASRVLSRNFKALAASAVATATAFLGFRAIKGLFFDAAQEIDRLAKAGQKLDILPERLAGLEVAASRTAVEAKQLELGLQRMTRRIAEAAQDTGEAKSALKELGLDARNLAAQSPDKQFLAIATAMRNVYGQSNKIRLAFKLFDSEGVNLLRTLSLTDKQLQNAFVDAERFGLAVSRVDAAKVEEMNDAIEDVKSSFRGLMIQLVPNLAGAITDIANSWTSMFTDGETASRRAQQQVAGIASVMYNLHMAIRYVNAAFVFMAGMLASVPTVLSRIGKGLTYTAKTLKTVLGFSSLMQQKSAAIDYNTPSEWDLLYKDLQDQFEALTTPPEKPEWLNKLETGDYGTSSADVVDPIADAWVDRGTATAIADIEALEAKMEEGARIAMQMRTPMEMYSAEIEQLNELLKVGAIDQTVFNRAVADAQQTLADAQEDLKSANEGLAKAQGDTADTFADSIYEGNDALSEQLDLTRAINKEVGKGRAQEVSGTIATGSSFANSLRDRPTKGATSIAERDPINAAANAGTQGSRMQSREMMFIPQLDETNGILRQILQTNSRPVGVV